MVGALGLTSTLHVIPLNWNLIEAALLMHREAGGRKE
jgi:hypothetical protein